MTETETGFPDSLKASLDKTIAEKVDKKERATKPTSEKSPTPDIRRCENCAHAWPSETKSIYRMTGARGAIVGRTVICGYKDNPLFMVPVLEKKPGCKTWKEIEKKP